MGNLASRNTTVRVAAAMTLRTHIRLAAIGFSLIFGSIIGSLVILSMPWFTTFESEILWYIALPTLIIGIAVMTFEKMHTPDADQEMRS
jgi:hypothetical protein